MNKEKIEKFFCNICKGKTNHFIRGEHTSIDYDDWDGTSLTLLLLIVECCGCENLALVKKTHFSEHVDFYQDPISGEDIMEPLWDVSIYPPVTYRVTPTWFEDLPDPTLRKIAREIYKSLETESHYLATFGSRTLIDRLIVLTVGDKGSFDKGLNALRDEGKISPHELEILQPVIQAGHAAAHRGWEPSEDQLKFILDTVEGLIHRLLVLPSYAEQLEEAFPSRGGGAKTKLGRQIVTVTEKIDAAPKALRSIYDELVNRLVSLGKDVTILPKKHYIAFRRSQHFASVQIYNQKKLIRAYLNIDPDLVEIDDKFMRDVRQIGHFGTGDLEVTIKSKRDIDHVFELIELSYQNS